MRKLLLQNDEEIEYIWVFGDGRMCAARAFDGTLYEFYRDNAQTPGVNERATPQHLSASGAFDFEPTGACNTPTCSSDVQIVFLIDEQSDVTPEDFNGPFTDYLQGIINTFDEGNNLIQMGAYFTVSGTVAPVSGPFGSNLGALAAEIDDYTKTNGETDWQAAHQAAINYFWPDPKLAGGAPRYLVSLVGGGSSEAFSDATMRNLRTARGIEAWSVGVSDGASQLTLLEALATLTPYKHYESLGSGSLLEVNLPSMAARLCPSQDLCGGNCNGFCACVDTCVCPTCVSPDPANLCLTAACDAQSANKACIVTDKGPLIAPAGCQKGDPCFVDTCVPATGECLSSPNTDTCGLAACSNCTAGPCETAVIDPNDCSCNLLPVVCPQTDLCNPQVCDPLDNNTCKVQPVQCDDGNSCTIDTCEVRDLGAGLVATCIYTPQDCNTTNACQAVEGCDGTGPVGICQFRDLPNLVDFCGVCLGDNVGCFFDDVQEFSTAGVAAGAIVGIVFAALVVVALLAFAGRKGYQAWMAKSDLGNANVQNNAAFVEGGMQGDMAV